MLNRITSRINIIYPIIMLILIFFTLILSAIRTEYLQRESLLKLKEQILFSRDISGFLNEVQVERGLSVGYSTNHNSIFKLKLATQREKTDRNIKRLFTYVGNSIKEIDKLTLIRTQIDKGVLKSSAILDYYSFLNKQLLNKTLEIAQNSSLPNITKKLISYSNLLYAKETLGIQRAVGTKIISSETLENKTILEFYALMVKQKQYLENIFKNDTEGYKESYENSINQKFCKNVKNVQETILSQNSESIRELDVNVWFRDMTLKINSLTELEKRFSKDIMNLIELKLTQVEYAFAINILLNLASVFIFMLIIGFIVKLIKNERKLQSLTDEYIISSTTDSKGIIVQASQAFLNISGYSKSELIGKPHSIVRHADMPASVFKQVWETIKAGKIWSGEIKNLKKNGEYYWTRSTIIPEFNKSNKVVGYTSLRHDITSEKSKEDFMANMSHELRTPLNAIIGFSSVLKKRIQEGKNLTYINHISESAAVLLKLINDILDLSKIKDSKFSVESYEFNAYEEMTQYAETFHGLTIEKEIEINIIIDKSLDGIFLGDWMRISQIILNLISNAVKFTANKGRIDFRAAYQNGSLVFSVKDNGIGMKKEVQDKIFKPFEQADGSTTREYGGTGLGLSITQDLLRHMNGNIKLNSAEGVGSTFSVEIPLKKEKTVVQEVTEIEEEKKSYNTHILVAEDYETNQELIKMVLEDLGVSCDIAKDGVEAVELYNPDIHAFILMDENMPNMNGLEAMKILKEKYKEKCGAIVALTANTMAGDREKFISLGMDDYLSKPLDEKELKRVLERFSKIVPQYCAIYLQKAIHQTQQKMKFSDVKIKKLLLSYQKNALSLLETFQDGIDNKNFEDIQRAAHNIKSSSYTFHFQEIGELAEVVELRAKNEEEFNYQESLETIKEHIEGLDPCIDQLFNAPAK